MIIEEKATEKQMKTEKRQNILPCIMRNTEHPPYFRRPHASRHVILHFAFSAWWDRALTLSLEILVLVTFRNYLYFEQPFFVLSSNFFAFWSWASAWIGPASIFHKVVVANFLIFCEKEASFPPEVDNGCKRLLGQCFVFSFFLTQTAYCGLECPSLFLYKEI